MWNEIVKYLGMFPSAVLTGIDSAGYPFSRRCTPRADMARQLLHIAEAGDGQLQPGPAGLLCHDHNDQLWDLKAVQVTGTLERAEQGWLFHPQRYVTGGALLGPLGQMQFVTRAQATARKYLQKRGLPRPKVRWDELEAVKKEAKKGK